MATKKLPVPVKAPHEPALLSTTVVYAIKALPEGKATPDQQSALLRWLLYEATKYYDMSYRPGGEEGKRDSDFAEGKRFVGFQILTALNLPPEAIAEMKKREDGGAPHDDEFPDH
jgi:hypothetical protein